MIIEAAFRFKFRRAITNARRKYWNTAATKAVQEFKRYAPLARVFWLTKCKDNSNHGKSKSES